jgi:Protein of unknown function (DUF1570)
MLRKRRRICCRLLGLAWLLSSLGVLAGCHSMPFLQLHPDKADSPKIDAAKAAADGAAGVLPGRYQYRLSQYVFLADFEIKRDLPLFKELAELREDVHKTLQLPASTNLVQVYLFEDRDRYERFMESKYPDLPKRRAFFIAQPHRGGEDLLVYTFWGNGDRIQQDLRHELTHALLHSVLKDVPLWLDEGLAEYFEIPPAAHAVNADHVKYLRHGVGGPVHPNLTRLEELTEVKQMSPTEYRESWAWVHLMLHSNDDARKVLVGYLKELRSTKTPGPLRPRLAAVFPTPEAALDRHLMVIDMNRRPNVMAN